MNIVAFISHSSEDEQLAAAIVKLLQSALAIPASSIRCTSVDGYGFPAGVDTAYQIRQDVLRAPVLVGLISRNSLRSTYVLFELGARWGRGKPLIPVLSADISPGQLKGPLAGLNALSCTNRAHLHQLVSDVGRVLDIKPQPPSKYVHHVESVLSVPASERILLAEDRLPADVEPPSVGSSFEPFFSVGPGDTADWALVFRILNSGLRDVTIRRAVYFLDNEKHVPILPDAKRSQVHVTGFEVKFGEQWKLLECFLKPGDEVISYVPLRHEVSAFEMPQGVRGELMLEYEVDGRAARHRAAL
jgi:hypothetical protein